MIHWKAVNCILLSRRVLNPVSLRIQRATWDLHLGHGVAIRTMSETLYGKREVSAGPSKMSFNSAKNRELFLYSRAKLYTSKCTATRTAAVSSSRQSCAFWYVRMLRYIVSLASGYRITIIVLRNLRALQMAKGRECTVNMWKYCSLSFA